MGLSRREFARVGHRHLLNAGIILAVFTWISLLVAIVRAEDYPIREWTLDGKLPYRARYVSFNSQIVCLRPERGPDQRVLISTLSQEDLEYLAPILLTELRKTYSDAAWEKAQQTEIAIKKSHEEIFTAVHEGDYDQLESIAKRYRDDSGVVP